MPYKITRFKPEHLELIEPREELKKEVDFIIQNKDYIKLYTNEMVSNTLWYDDIPLMVYGFHNNGIGTYTVFVISHKDLSKHKFAAIKAIYKYYEEYVMSDVRRLEAYVNLDDSTALRFAKWFGFAIIGIRHKASYGGYDQAILERLQRKASC